MIDEYRETLKNRKIEEEKRERKKDEERKE